MLFLRNYLKQNAKLNQQRIFILSKLHQQVELRYKGTYTFKSSFQDIPIPNKTLTEVLFEKIDKSSDSTAYICGKTHKKVSFYEFRNSVEKVATSLAKKGLKKGDVVLTNAINCLEYPVMNHAISLLGGILSPASPQFGSDELICQMKICKPKFIITHSAVKQVAIDAAKKLHIPRENTFCIGNNVSEDSFLPFNILEDIHDHQIDYPHVNINANTDISFLPFSSGTTGIPKGVNISFRNILANTIQCSHMDQFSDNLLILLPLFHSYASLLGHMSLYQGIPGIILPGFIPELFLETLQTYKLPKVHIVPPIVIFLAKHPLVDKYDISNTKYLISGAAPLGANVEEIIQQRLKMKVKQAYGMTELSPCSHYMTDHKLKSGSIGQLVPNTEQRVVCLKTGKSLPPGELGEFCIRGPQVMLGYKDREDATKQTISEDGFLHTGDIGYIDEEGDSFIVDRLKELIKYKAHQIAPAELESVLVSHPDITDAACVRGRNEEGEEIPKAYVVLAKGKTLSEKEVIDYVAQHVAPYKKVRQIQFIDAIPKSATGKILRRVLQESENKSNSKVEFNMNN